MKFFKFLTMATLIVNSGIAQTNVKKVDLEKYSGKWFVIATIPTAFDKNWNYVTETYTINNKGNIDIYTTYLKESDTKPRSVRSKGFPLKETNNISWKVQFIWPFKADYLIEEIDPNYFYVVIGHPKKKFLYIMNRTGQMGQIQYEEILDRFSKKGYDLSKVRVVMQ
ncbi:MAG: lipocalin family protein [Bacteroidetes bacterium]|nr:lipocalin family protein [Bacteroidota bacterium]